MTLLAAMTACFQNRHAFYACFKQGVFDCIQLGRLENGFDLLHKPKNLARILLAVTASSLSGWCESGILQIDHYRWGIRLNNLAGLDSKSRNRSLLLHVARG